MARFRWQVLQPGTRCVGRDADGQKRFETFSPARIRRYAKLANEFISKGRDIPIVLAHRDDARPRKLNRDDWQTERTKGIVGYPQKFEVDAQDVCWAEGDVPDEADAKTVEKVKYCSPEINDHLESDGTEYPDVFTHLAITGRPVQIPQVAATRLGNNWGPIRLAFDPEKGTDMADEKEEKPKEEKPKEEKPEEKKKSISDALIEALRDCGIPIPEEVKDEEGLIIAVKAYHGKDGEKEDEMEEYGADDIEPVNRPAPISMSLEEREQRVEKSEERLKKRGRKEIADRLQGLLDSKRILPAEFQEKKASIEKIRLSFDQDGEIKPNALLVWIEARESLPKGAAWAARQPEGKKGKTRLGNRDVGPAARPDHTPQDDPIEDESTEARKKRMDALDEMGVKK